MNSEEGMSMAKMAVTVLLVVLVISAVIAIVYAAYDWFSKGKDSLENNVTSIEASKLAHYDNTTVSGSEVLSTLTSNRESDLTIFIANNNLQGSTGFDPEADTVSCLAYCAMPAQWTAGTQGTLSKNDSNAAIGDQFSFGGFEMADDGISIVRNTNFSTVRTKSNKEAFVKESGKWYANLVYDTNTGEVGGILFRQMN